MTNYHSIDIMYIDITLDIKAETQVMMSGTVVEKGSKAVVADANIILQNPEGNNWEGYSSIKELEQLKDSRASSSRICWQHSIGITRSS